MPAQTNETIVITRTLTQSVIRSTPEAEPLFLETLDFLDIWPFSHGAAGLSSEQPIVIIET